MKQSRPLNRIEIDLAAFRHNLKVIRRSVGSGTKLLIVVKADAYGHGMVPIAREAVRSGDSAYLGVASSAEAFALRGAGIRSPILVLGVTHPRDAVRTVKEDVTAALSTREEALVLNRAAARLGRKARVHVELDTGMGRLGVWCAEAVRFLYETERLGNLDLEGVFTHFPNADSEDAAFSANQIEIFKKAVEIAGELIERPFRYVHMANSAGLVAFRDAHFNLVRPGIMAYGINPARRKLPFDLRPVLSLKSCVTLLKRVEAGRSISYARTFITRRPTRIATVSLGYSSGYPLSLSNRSEALIAGRRFPIVGRITMDHLMVDVGPRDRVRRWDEAVLIGRSGREVIRAEDLAERAGTIPYEIVCGLSAALPRLYKNARR